MMYHDLHRPARAQRFAKEQTLAKLDVPFQKALVEWRLTHGAFDLSCQREDPGRRPDEEIMQMGRVSFDVAAEALHPSDEIDAAIDIISDNVPNEGFERRRIFSDVMRQYPVELGCFAEI